MYVWYEPRYIVTAFKRISSLKKDSLSCTYVVMDTIRAVHLGLTIEVTAFKDLQAIFFKKPLIVGLTAYDI
jgi:hypothetical protein